MISESSWLKIRDMKKVVWFKATHYTTQAQALEDAGYATKKNEDGELIYADILIDLIKKYNLQLLDREVQEIN